MRSPYGNLLLCCLFGALAGCAGGSGQSLPVNPGQPGAAPDELPSGRVLEQMLAGELQRLGKDPQRITAALPGQGGAVFNLSAHLLDEDGNDEGESVDLSWTYRSVGDYDQNGQVNVSDLTPLALFWQQQAIYDDAEAHAGITYWPSGQPLADGGVDPGSPPAPGSGAANWRIAAVDGDHNGLVNLSDITPIAVSFGATLTQYGIYRRENGTEEFSLVGTRALPAAPGGRPLSLSYNDPLNVEDRGKLWEYSVRPLEAEGGASGPDSNIAIAVFDDSSGFPLAEMQADPSEGTIPLTVHFTALTEAAPLGSIVRHEWDLDGDGSYELNTGLTTETEHTYGSSGSYIARLRATDDAGRTAIAGRVITVGTAPVAILKADPQGGEVPVKVHFDARSSYSELGELTKYEWDFDGDGAFELDSGPVAEQFVDFTAAGSFSVSLRVTDNIGLQAIDSLALSFADDYDEIEPNQSSQLASPIGAITLDAAPVLVAGNVGSGGYSGDQSDWWSFSVPQGCELSLTAETGGLDPILRVRLVDVEGSLSLAEISNLESVKQLSRGLRGAGTYFLQVVNEHTITGLDYDYSLALQASPLTLDEVENNDNPAQANPLGNLSTSILPGIWGSLGPDGEDGDDADWYSFTVLNADDYSFGLDFFHHEADLELALYDSTGLVLFGVSESVTDRERIDATLEPGEYRLRCYRNEGGTAFYQLSLFFTP